VGVRSPRRISRASAVADLPMISGMAGGSDGWRI
jgi:hypothetical protein